MFIGLVFALSDNSAIQLNVPSKVLSVGVFVMATVGSLMSMIIIYFTATLIVYIIRHPINFGFIFTFCVGLLSLLSKKGRDKAMKSLKNLPQKSGNKNE